MEVTDRPVKRQSGSSHLNERLFREIRELKLEIARLSRYVEGNLCPDCREARLREQDELFDVHIGRNCFK